MKRTPSRYLSADHKRLEALLDQATKDPSNIDLTLYEEFRKGLLRHIAIEEKIVFPRIQRETGDALDRAIEQLRLDHGAIAALLVPTPNASVLHTLVRILQRHNLLEEQQDSVYEKFDARAGDAAQAAVDEFEATPEVRLHPLRPLEDVLDAVKRAVTRAGYELTEALP